MFRTSICDGYCKSIYHSCTNSQETCKPLPFDRFLCIEWGCLYDTRCFRPSLPSIGIILKCPIFKTQYVYVRFVNEIHVVVVVDDTKISSKSHKSPYQHYVNGGVYVISDRSRTITQVPLSTVFSFYVGWEFVFCRLYLFNVPIS